MTVEIIQPPADGILDLTKQGQPVLDKPAEVTPDAPIELPADDKVGTPSSDTDAPKDDGEASWEEFYFGDSRVVVDVPEEIATALTEAGIDQKQLLSELFAKDGKFELSEGNRAKLEAKYGKLMVDGYLKMYRTMNEQAVVKFASEAKTEQERIAAQHSEYNEVVGGAQGIESLEAFVLSSYDDKQIASYNAVMSGDSFDAQMLVLRAVRSEMQAKEKLEKGDKTPALIGDNSPASTPAASSDGVPAQLSAVEYAKIMDDTKYFKDKDYQRKVDAARIAGLRAGI